MASEAAVPAGARPEKTRLVYPKLGIPFVLLLLCFAAWGAAANLTDVLVGVFRTIFDMSNFQSALVQFAYYGAYFSLAIPAALINRRYSCSSTGSSSLLFLCWRPACPSSRPRPIPS